MTCVYPILKAVMGKIKNDGSGLKLYLKWHKIIFKVQPHIWI